MTSLRQYADQLRGRSKYTLKKLTNGADPFSGAALARTLGNYDGKATNGTGTWVDNAGVNGDPMGGVGPLAVVTSWPFCSPAINDGNGKCSFIGGGHAQSGDSSLFGFDSEAAAASLLSGGSGGTWSLRVKGARYLDAFTDTVPVWSFQTNPTPTGTHQNYWATTNADGVQMWASIHSYQGMMHVPGTNKILVSGKYAWDAQASGQMGAMWVYDDSTDAVQGPYHPVTGTGISYLDGFMGQIGDLGEWPCCVSLFDRNVYAWNGDQANHSAFMAIHRSPEDPSTCTQVDPNLGSNGTALPAAGTGMIVCPDVWKSTGGTALLYQHRANGLGDTRYYVVRDCVDKDFVGASASLGTYTRSATTQGSAFAYAFDPLRRCIYVSDNTNLFRVVPGANDTTGWTIDKITLSTSSDSGAFPTAAGGTIPRLAYVPSADALVMVQESIVSVVSLPTLPSVIPSLGSSVRPRIFSPGIAR
jgi:hypothetical protein